MEEKEMKVKHIMKDGTVRESMEGYILPDELSLKIINILLKSRERQEKEKNFKNGQKRE